MTAKKKTKAVIKTVAPTTVKKYSFSKIVHTLTDIGILAMLALSVTALFLMSMEICQKITISFGK